MIAVDQIDSKLPCLQKDTVFYVRGHKRVAAALPGVDQRAPARAAENGDVLHRSAGVIIAQTSCVQGLFAVFKKRSYFFKSRF